MPARELKSRQNDGLLVEILWESERDEVWLRVSDQKNPERDFFKEIPRDAVNKAFVHPYLYEPDHAEQIVEKFKSVFDAEEIKE
jgi:hypothetical protein